MAASLGYILSQMQRWTSARLEENSGGAAQALAHSVLRAMILPKLAGVLAITMTLALAVSTTAVLLYRGSMVEVLEAKRPAVPVLPKDAEADKPQVRTDALGDPLPAGAIARLGSVRFRHGGFISYVAFTPDGKRLISKGIDGVRVWDSATGKELWHIPLEANWERGTVDLSPDGKILAAIDPGPGRPFDQGPGKPILLWDVDSGKQIGSLGAKLWYPIRFSPNGRWLAAATGERDVELWDLSSRKRLLSLTAHDAHPWSIAFSADSRKLVTSDWWSKVHFWDAVSGRKLQEFKPLIRNASHARRSFNAVSADGKLLAILEDQESGSPTPITEPKARISIWDTATGRMVRELVCPSPKSTPDYVVPFSDLTFAPDGKTLVTTGPDSFLRFWDPATGKVLRRFPIEDSGRFTFLAFSRDGKSQVGASRCRRRREALGSAHN